MGIVYIGPKSLEGIFQEEYAKISADYERHHPMVVAGMLGHKPDSGIAGFPTRQHFNDYVDETVNLLLDMLYGCHAGPFPRLVERIHKTHETLREKRILDMNWFITILGDALTLLNIERGPKDCLLLRKD